MTIPIPQIAAVSVAFLAFAGLLATSQKLRIRPWIVLVAGISGIALVFLVNILVHKTNSLGSLAVGLLLVCVAGALLSLMASMLVQRFVRRPPVHDLQVSKAGHVQKNDGSAAEAPSDGLATAQINEIALLSGYTSARAALTLIAPGNADSGKSAEEPSNQLLPMVEESTLEEMERLEQGFRLELERLENEQAKQREQARASLEERERQALQEEERRMKEEQIKITNEAQLVRERIKRERERVAQEDKQKQDADLAASQDLENKKAAEKAAAEERWRQEEERLARELEERRREQEKAAEAEKLWLEEQKLLAQEQERLAQEKAESQAKDEAERLAMEVAGRLAEMEAERLATEEADRLAKEEADRLATEEADRLAKEEAEKLEQERQRLEEQNALDQRISEAGEYMQTAMKLVATGMLAQALAWMEKAARLDTTNEMKVSNNVVIVETLMMLGWKNEALKKMQTMKSTLQIDAATKKKLGELATRLLS